MLLSICVPAYNRAIELERLLKTIPVVDAIEIVICDDGSTDGTKKLVDDYSQIHNIEYIKQKNQGRAIALKEVILKAKGKYTILMDSDDYFLENWYDIVHRCIIEIENNEKYKNIKSFVLGTHLIKGEEIDIVLPPSNIVTNFVAIKADYNVKKDLKQIVATSILQQNIYDYPLDMRRVPTSLLWTKVAKVTKCLSIKEPIAVKEYLPGGMSANILKLKASNALPLVDLNLILLESNLYNSKIFRWKSKLLFIRYSFHANKKIKFDEWWKFLFILPGFSVYIIDKLKLSLQA